MEVESWDIRVVEFIAVLRERETYSLSSFSCRRYRDFGPPGIWSGGPNFLRVLVPYFALDERSAWRISVWYKFLVRFLVVSQEL